MAQLAPMPVAFEQVLAGKIHNLKNALQVLNVELDLMALPPEEAARRARIHRQCNYLNRTLMQLLRLYKIEQGQSPVTPLPMDLYDFADLLRQDAQVFLKPSLELRFDHRFDPDDATAWVDEQAVLDIAVSAVDNACRHARRQILVVIEHQGGWLRLEVHDDGAGFGSSLPDPSDGQRTGLGLALARSVAQLHHNARGEVGLVELEASPMLGGALFRLALPS